VPVSQGSGWDCVKCVPVLGDQAAGEPCLSDGATVGTDDCDASSWCFTYDEGEGTCRAFCGGAADDPECAPGSTCWISNEGSIVVCVPACDPVLQDCEQGLGCYWSGAIFGCIFTYTRQAINEPCGYLNDCEPGLYCTDAAALPNCMAARCCSPFCNIGLGDTPCEALPGTACVSFFLEGEAPVGYEHVGLCMLPP
jgi:hypothetical protein